MNAKNKELNLHLMTQVIAVTQLLQVKAVTQLQVKAVTQLLQVKAVTQRNQIKLKQRLKK